MDKTTPSRPSPFREDCWSEDATSTLVDTWGRRYVELNRGNLRQKDWQDVADVVNSLHGQTKKTHRTDVQCKNRIDTLKKKYKVEKAKIVESNGNLTSSWPFFSRMDVLIGSNYEKLSQPVKLSPLGLGFRDSASFSNDFNSPPMGVPLPYRKLALPPPPAAMVQTPQQMAILPQKRAATGMAMGLDGSSFMRKYSMMAAAAAKDVVEEDEEEEDEEVEENVEEEGMRKLARAIESFGEMYERVEEMKQRQMVELEKQRMQFTKDLEVQRMQLFMDTQVQLEKIKRAKRSGGGSADGMEFKFSVIFQQFNQLLRSLYVAFFEVC